MADTIKGRHCASLRSKAPVVAAPLSKGADATTRAGISSSTSKYYAGKTTIQLCHESWAAQGTKDFDNTLALLLDHDHATAAQDSLLIATAAANGSITILQQLHQSGGSTGPNRQVRMDSATVSETV